MPEPVRGVTLRPITLRGACQSERCTSGWMRWLMAHPCTRNHARCTSRRRCTQANHTVACSASIAHRHVDCFVHTPPSGCPSCPTAAIAPTSPTNPDHRTTSNRHSRRKVAMAIARTRRLCRYETERDAMGSRQPVHDPASRRSYPQSSDRQPSPGSARARDAASENTSPAGHQIPRTGVPPCASVGRGKFPDQARSLASVLTNRIKTWG